MSLFLILGFLLESYLTTFPSTRPESYQLLKVVSKGNAFAISTLFYLRFTSVVPFYPGYIFYCATSGKDFSHSWPYVTTKYRTLLKLYFLKDEENIDFYVYVIVSDLFIHFGLI